MTPNLSLTYIAVVIVCILISLAVHEFMHAYIGYKLGDDTAKDEGRLTLNPISHIDPIMTIALPIVTIIFFGAPILAAKPVPFSPDRVKYDEFGAAMIAAAGPFSNLVMAFFGAIVVKYLSLGAFMNEALGIFIGLNVAIFVFNLLPIPPLDGSRVLYAFSPEGLQNLLRQLEPFGLVIVFGLIFVANLGQFLLTLNQYVLNILP